MYTIVAILSFRGNGQALQLSELGAYLPGSAREPAKTKRGAKALDVKEVVKKRLRGISLAQSRPRGATHESGGREAVMYLGWKCPRKGGE